MRWVCCRKGREKGRRTCLISSRDKDVDFEVREVLVVETFVVVKGSSSGMVISVAWELSMVVVVSSASIVTVETKEDEHRES